MAAKKQYLFVLGRDPELARLEIESVLDRIGVEYKILNYSHEVAVVELASFNIELIEEFGGIKKIAEVLCNSSKAEVIEREMNKYELYNGTENKVTYFVDSYETDIDEYVESYLKNYFKGIRVKASVKKESYPTRLIKKNTISEGLEIVMFRNYVARTVAVSNPLLLKERDLGRPKTDYMKTISLRLAKILINLSMVKKGEMLLDPFCGSGGVLQEALLKSVNVIGIDSDKAAIEESKFNMEWLEKKFKLKAKWKIIRCDATRMATNVQYCDGVATEPYLGPYIKKTPNLFQAKGIVAELRDLYAQVFKEIQKVLKKNGRVSFIVPKFKTIDGKKVSIDMQGIALANGFVVVHGPILYAYKESKILREIYVLEKR